MAMANELKQFKSEFGAVIGQLKSLVDPIAREKMEADRKTSLTNYQNEVSILKSQIKKTKKELSDITVSLKQKKSDTNKILSELGKSLQVSIDTSKNTKMALEDEIEALKAGKTEAGLKLQERESACEVFEKRLEECKKSLRDTGDDLDTRGDELTKEAITIEKDRKDVDRQLKTLQSSKAQLKEAESRVNDFKKELDSMSEKLAVNKAEQAKDKLALESKAISVAKMEEDVLKLLSNSQVSQKQYEELNTKEEELLSRGEALKRWDARLKDQDRENAVQARALRVEAANIHNREKAVKALELELTK